MRLNKFMAGAGVASRRKCDDIILEGRVKVNARVIKKLGVQIDPNNDIVT
ncbi:MAG: pseudouridine synthase, partial [Clostridia bacterium]|nr:pseudouridine synthase [Clostridia bacterium]